MVAMASASNATKVTASTRPTDSRRRSGAHIPPDPPAAKPVGFAEVSALSVPTRVRLGPQLPADIGGYRRPRQHSARSNTRRGGTGAPPSMYWETPALFNDAVARFLKDVKAA